MRKVLAFVKTSTQAAISYRADVLLFVLAGLSQPIVILALWMAVIYSGAHTPISSTEIVQYYLLVIIVNLITSTWASPFISRDIRLGNLSPYLLKPTSYLHFQAGNNLGEKAIKSIYLLPVIAIIAFISKAQLPFPNLLQFLATVISLAGAYVISFFLDICIGLTSFWLEDSEAVDDLLGISGAVFSGKMVPLVTLPLFAQQLARFLPFRYTISFPIEVIMGKLSTQEIVHGLLIQLVWLVVMLLVYKLLWQRGLVHYSAVGA